MGGPSKERLQRGWGLVCAALLMGCGGGSASIQLSGTWKVTYVTCNGVNITSNYVPAGGTLTYAFEGSTLVQTKTSPTCGQTTTMPYTLDGTAFTVASGSTYSIICTPPSCTDTGLASASMCGTSGMNPSSVVTTVTSFTGTVMTTREYDSQATSICTTYAGTTPFTMSMSKQ